MWLRGAGLDEGTEDPHLRASGSIGSAAAQLSRHFEADVTAVCNTRIVEIVKSLGADRVIDYTSQDFTRECDSHDIIFDAVGKLSFRRCRCVEVGRDLPADGSPYEPVPPPVDVAVRGQASTLPIPPPYSKEDVLFLKGLLKAGKYHAVIDRCYPLEKVVEATGYVETARKTGNVVLTVGG